MKLVSIAAILLFVSVMASPAFSIKPGGISDNEKPMTADLKKTLEVLQPELRVAVGAKTNADTNNVDFEPVAYKTQVVAGVNYFVKYRIGNSNNYIHARIYKPLGGGDLQLVRVSDLKSEADPISYF